MPVIAHFHEDDYCQIEILPLDLWTSCAVQMGDVRVAARNLDASGPSWKQIYPLTPQSVASMRLSRATLLQILCRHLPEFDEVQTGTYSTVTPTGRTEGFGFNPYVGLFFDYDETEIVQHIWLVSGVIKLEERNSYLRAFADLSLVGGFLLADWAKGRLLQLNDAAVLSDYLASYDGGR